MPGVWVLVDTGRRGIAECGSWAEGRRGLGGNNPRWLTWPKTCGYLRIPQAGRF